MRIIAGKLKGQKILAPKTFKTRPATALFRKILFDTCQPQIFEAKALDLFAGSGAIGFEAISRGASKVLFVEMADMPIKTIKKNAENLKVQDQISIFKGDAFKLFPKILDKELNLLFVDPPYTIGLEKYIELLNLIDTNTPKLHPEALLFLESPTQFSRELRETPLTHLQLRKEKKSGTTTLLIYERI